MGPSTRDSPPASARLGGEPGLAEMQSRRTRLPAGQQPGLRCPRRRPARARRPRHAEAPWPRRACGRTTSPAADEGLAAGGTDRARRRRRPAPLGRPGCYVRAQPSAQMTQPRRARAWHLSRPPGLSGHSGTAYRRLELIRTGAGMLRVMTSLVDRLLPDQVAAHPAAAATDTTPAPRRAPRRPGPGPGGRAHLHARTSTPGASCRPRSWAAARLPPAGGGWTSGQGGGV